MAVSIPQGYKQTEVGVIPEDWHCVPMGDAVIFFGGNGFSSTSESTYGVKWLKIANVGVHRISWEAESFLPEQFLNEYKNYLLKSGDVVMALTRPILSGRLKVAKLCKADEPSLLNQRVAKLIPKKGNDLSYIYFIVQRDGYVAAMNLAMAGTDPPNIGNYALERIKVPIPPTKTEQTAIANVLSDADAWIQSLTRLIAKKRRIKQGAMQRLLNPYEVGVLKKGWVVKTLGDVCKLINGRGFKPYEWDKDGLPIIRIQNLNGSDDFNYYSGDYDKKIEVENGQLLFAWSGSRGTSFGPHVWRGSLGLLNYHTWKVMVDKDVVDTDFFLHALRELTKFIEDKAHGASALVHTQKWEMEGFELAMPESHSEQTRIATILSDMGSEITQLETKLTKAKTLKQGMMQNLLTGKIRLVEPEAHRTPTPCPP